MDVLTTKRYLVPINVTIEAEDPDAAMKKLGLTINEAIGEQIEKPEFAKGMSRIDIGFSIYIRGENKKLYSHN